VFDGERLFYLSPNDRFMDIHDYSSISDEAWDEKVIELATSGVLSRKHRLDDCYLQTLGPAPKPLAVKLL
jgi:hypothetical protein